MGRFIESYIIQPNPKMENGGWTTRDLSFLFIEMTGQKQVCVMRKIMNLMNLSQQVWFLGLCELCGR